MIQKHAYAGLPGRSIEREGHDRSDTALPGLQSDFAKKVLALGKPTVIVLVSGGPMAIDELVTRKEAAGFAITQAFFPSRMGAEALAMSLLGKENRWGKLPITMYPHSYITEQNMTNYDMSAAPGRTYKYYQGEPLFRFGYGLSLTTWDFKCSQQARAFSCQLKNTGPLYGEEVIQLYHSAQSLKSKVDHPLPLRALRDFQRVPVPSGGVATVNFEVANERKKINTSLGRLGFPVLVCPFLSNGFVWGSPHV